MKKIITLAIIASSILMAEVSPEIKKTVQEVVPNTTISKIDNAEISGLYKAYTAGGQILYISPEKKLIFFGEVWNTDGVSLTQQDIESYKHTAEYADAYKREMELHIKSVSAKLTKEKIEQLLGAAFLSKSDAGIKDKKYKIITLTSPTCPRCKELFDYVSKEKIKTYKLLSYQQESMEYLMSSSKGVTRQGVENQLKTMNEASKDLGTRWVPVVIIVDSKTNELVEFFYGADIQKLAKYSKEK